MSDWVRWTPGSLDLEQVDDGATMHFGAVMVFDALSEGGTPSLNRVRGHVDERLQLLPRYRKPGWCSFSAPTARAHLTSTRWPRDRGVVRGAAPRGGHTTRTRSPP